MAAIDIATPAFVAFGLVLAANPLTWVAIGVGALVMLAIKVKPVRDAFIDAFRWIKTAGADAFNWIEGHWRLLAVILLGPFGPMIDFATKHFHAIVAVATWVVGAVKTVFKAVFPILAAPFEAVWSVAKTIAVAIVHAVSWMVTQIGHLLSKCSAR